MSNCFTFLHPRRRLVPMVFVTMWVIIAHAQGPTAPIPPYMVSQYATLIGAGNTIIAMRVPVTKGDGKTIYTDLTLQFDVDADGNLTLSSGYPQASLSPSLAVSPFMPGRYVGPSTVLSGKGILNVIGPGVATGGATIWFLSSATGADRCTYPPSATWYVGPFESSPYVARLKKAGLTSTTFPWSYGVTGVSVCNNGANWSDNTLIGVSQIGNTLTIASFTTNSGLANGPTDKATPVDQITYTLQLAPTP